MNIFIICSLKVLIIRDIRVSWVYTLIDLLCKKVLVYSVDVAVSLHKVNLQYL